MAARVWRLLPTDDNPKTPQARLNRDLSKQADGRRKVKVSRARRRIREFLDDEPSVTRLGKSAKGATGKPAGGAYGTGGEGGCVIVERAVGSGRTVEKFVGGDVQRLDVEVKP